MAIQINIEKNFKGFSLKSVFESNTSATGILGASGSGKSMTLRCIAGIETPDRGKIVINGRTVFDSEKKINLKPQERRIGYLFQNYALFPTMTVKDNILCGYRGEKGQREEKARDFMKRYQLEVLENRYPSQLSGGQQQRVALARTLAQNPEIILADEPVAALDPVTAKQVMDDFDRINKEMKITVLINIHHVDLALKYASRVIGVRAGEVVYDGPSENVDQAVLDKIYQGRQEMKA